MVQTADEAVHDGTRYQLQVLDARENDGVEKPSPVHMPDAGTGTASSRRSIR